jgi:hypothetical protein
MVPLVAFVDPVTGCHWWRSGMYGEILTPRMDRGRQLCEGPQEVAAPKVPPSWAGSS